MMWLVEERKQFLPLRISIITQHPSIKTAEGTLESPFSLHSFPSIELLTLGNDLYLIATCLLPLEVVKDKLGGKGYSCGRKAAVIHWSWCMNYCSSQKIPSSNTVPGCSLQHHNFPDAQSLLVSFCS